MNDDARLERLFAKPEKADILYFLNTNHGSSIKKLYKFAGKVRNDYLGNEFHLRGLIEFSNYCRRACTYCGLRHQNRQLQRYRMRSEEIVSIAKIAIDAGYKTIVLQSGEDLEYSLSDYRQIVHGIKSKGDIAVTMAIGERTEAEYRKLRSFGADRFLLKHETSDAELYRQLNPGMTLSKRIEALKTLKRLGFQVGSGIMLGLPGQRTESIADDILLFKSLDLDMIGCGPYIPHLQTPLRESASGSVVLATKVLALNRIVSRNALLPYTTALSVLSKNTKAVYGEPYFRPANVMMPKLTPLKYQKLYDIYPNNEKTDCNSAAYFQSLKTSLADFGFNVADHPGHRCR